ncbi:MAG: hypothetical protein AB8G86_25630, partial [Saprospiraceae bacterium]
MHSRFLLLIYFLGTNPNYAQLTEQQKRILTIASLFQKKERIEDINDFVEIDSEELIETVKLLNRWSLIFIEEEEFFVHRLTSDFIINEKILELDRERLYERYAIWAMNYADAFLDKGYNSMAEEY